MERSEQQRALWHPYTKASSIRESSLPCIVRGHGPDLIDSTGRRWVDAISSWWCMSLGHTHPEIVAAIQEQAAVLPHSILGHLSHPRAEQLALTLASMMPDPQRKVLFASDGASAIEQAMKMALQYFWNRGETGRVRFAALSSAYHGDTLGALSVGYLPDWHEAFRATIHPAYSIPLPPLGEPVSWRGATHRTEPFDWNALDRMSDQLAAVVVEPLCLGASGMRMYGAHALEEIASWCRGQGVLLIVDEIAMGFGRTGRMFAFEHAGVDPDIVCLGKALSAGHMPISATVARQSIFDSFDDASGADRTLQHGHTFCGHPIGCAAALAALDIYRRPEFLSHVYRLGQQMASFLLPLAGSRGIRQVRCLGLLGAVELEPTSSAHLSRRAQRIRTQLFEQGVLLRPLGDVLYLAPPLNMSTVQLQDLLDRFVCAMDAVPA